MPKTVTKSLEQKLDQFQKKKILVIGDIMLDIYTHGQVSRVSPEAPVLILKKDKADTYIPGGAANVANNVAALGAIAVIAGVIGDDHYKPVLLKTLEENNIDVSGIHVSKSRPTIIKHRFVSGSYHQLLRLDEEESNYLNKADEDSLLAKIKSQLAGSDLVILSDYAKGVFSKSLTQEILSLAKKEGKKVIADIKPQNKEAFKGVDLILPNAKEAFEMSGQKTIQNAGHALMKFFDSDVIITRSEEGLSVFEKMGKVTNIPGKKLNVYDVSGAGDTVTAIMGLCMTSGITLEEAAFIGNCGGVLVVQKAGTATLSLEELKASLRQARHLEDILVNRKVWGYEKWLENNSHYCCKLLSLNKGYQCSLHYHKKKDEMFFVLKGHVRLELDGKVTHLLEGNYIRIKPGVKHRFRGMENSLFIEVSTHHDESDSHRIEASRKAD